MALIPTNTTGKQISEDDQFGGATGAEITAAQVAAEAAQAAAELAQTGAESAQTAAETAQGLAESAQTGAETAQGLAEDAQTAAEAAQAAAEAATLQRSGGDATGVVIERIGATATEGLEIVVVDKVVQLNAAAAASFPVFTIPANSQLMSIQMNLQDNIAASTAVKVGLTDAGGESLIGLTPDLIKNSKSDYIPIAIQGLGFPQTGTHEISIFAADTAGAPAGTLGGSTPTDERVRVRIIYATMNSLDNAA